MVDLASDLEQRRDGGVWQQDPFPPLPYAPLPVFDTEDGPVFVHPRDRIYGVQAIGSQGSGKTSAMLRLYLNDVMDPNACIIVLDPKSELTQLCLALTEPACGKKVWYLDLGRPDFGMSPLHRDDRGVDFVTSATAIADGVVAALSALNADQIFASSKQFLNHAVIGALVMAKVGAWEPTFEDVHELLLPDETAVTARNAVVEACRHFPDLYETQKFYERELPNEIRMNAAVTAQRLAAPRNKIAQLVGVPAVRRFLNHKSDVPLSEIIAARDILLVDANMAAIGQDSSSTCMAFIFQLLHQQLQQQVHLPEHERPRVALHVDEAHYLITETVIDQVATHRAAGLDATFGLQYPAQLGASAANATITQKIRDGFTNLVQTRFMFRLGEPKDAEASTRIAMAVYESMIRADSRDYQRIGPEQIMNFPVWHALISMMANGTRIPSFIGRTYAFPLFTSMAWRVHHLADLLTRVAGYEANLGTTGRRKFDPAVMARRAAEIAAETGAAVNGAAAANGTSNGDAGRRNETGDAAAAWSAAVDGDTPHRAATAPGESADRARRRTPAADDVIADAVVVEEAAGAVETRDGGTVGDDSGSPHVVQVRTFDHADRPTAAGSDVLRVVGRDAADLDHAPGTGETAPPLLQMLADVDRVDSIGDWSTVEGKPPKMTRDNLAVLSVLDRMGLALRDSLGYAVLGPDATLRAVQSRLHVLHEGGMVSRASANVKSPTGGGTPSIYTITVAGFRAAQRATPRPGIDPERKTFRKLEGEGTRIPHDHHVLHYLLQLVELLGHDVVTDNWRTPRVPGGHCEVPHVGNGRDRHQVTQRDLRSLREGEAVTGLACMEPAANGGSGPGFTTVAPDATIEIRIANARRGERSERRGLTFDLMLEMDRTHRPSYNDVKFPAYDALLTGWWSDTKRYGQLGTRPVVLFVTRDWAAAQACAREADRCMTGAVALQGRPASEWYYAGRQHIFFAAEEDLYFRSFRALALDPLPPTIRAALGHGAGPQPRTVSLLPPSMIQAARRKRHT